MFFWFCQFSFYFFDFIFKFVDEIVFFISDSFGLWLLFFFVTLCDGDVDGVAVEFEVVCDFLEDLL